MLYVIDLLLLYIQSVLNTLEKNQEAFIVEIKNVTVENTVL